MAICNILWPFDIFKVIWYILRPFGIFYGHLVYFTVIWCVLRPFGIFYGHLVYFSPIWYVVPSNPGFHKNKQVKHWPLAAHSYQSTESKTDGFSMEIVQKGVSNFLCSLRICWPNAGGLLDRNVCIFQTISTHVPMYTYGHMWKTDPLSSSFSGRNLILIWGWKWTFLQ
jgi:hypothetical protein